MGRQGEGRATQGRGSVTAILAPLPHQELNRHGIGASQAAAALSLSPWTPPIVLWSEMVGELPPFEGNELTTWGRHEEPAIRSWYVEHTGHDVHVPPESLFHPEMDWMRATPDGIIVGAGQRWEKGLEIKKANWRQAHRWGEPGTDDVPIEYAIQCAYSMAVTNLPVWDLCVSIGGDPPAIYTIERDLELEADMVEGVAEFWELVQERVAPDLDDTKKFGEYLARKYADCTDALVPADQSIEESVERLKEIKGAQSALKSERQGIENEITEFIGEARGVETKLGRLTWSRLPGKISWKDFAMTLCQRQQIAGGEMAQQAAKHVGNPYGRLNTPQWNRENQ